MSAFQKSFTLIGEIMPFDQHVAQQMTRTTTAHEKMDTCSREQDIIQTMQDVKDGSAQPNDLVARFAPLSPSAASDALHSQVDSMVSFISTLQQFKDKCATSIVQYGDLVIALSKYTRDTDVTTATAVSSQMKAAITLMDARAELEKRIQPHEIEDSQNQQFLTMLGVSSKSWRRLSRWTSPTSGRHRAIGQA